MLAAGIVIVAILYVFGVTKPPAKPEPAMQGAMQSTVREGATVTVEFSDILQKARATVSGRQSDSIALLEMNLEKARGKADQAQSLERIGAAWANTGNIIVAGKYYEEAAALTGDIKTWEEAANRFYVGFPTAADSVVKAFAVQQAIKCFETLRKLDSNNLDYPVREAICYIDGQGQIMQGVTLLKEVEKTDPDNKDMNLILGRLSVVSGQFDKAVTRLEKLTKLDPENAEAYFHLAEAYRALGRKDDAIKSLETCKSLVKDVDFRNEIDLYINQIKK